MTRKRRERPMPLAGRVLLSKAADRIHVEVFELSPLNRPVLTTKGRLRRSFPGFALALHVDVFREPDM